MVDDTQVVVSIGPWRPCSKTAVTIRLPGGQAPLVFEAALADQAKRRAFVEEVCSAHPGIDNQELLDLIATEIADAVAGRGDRGDDDRQSQADRIVQLALSTEGFQLFHTKDHVGIAVFPVGDHVENWPLASSRFRERLIGIFFEEAGAAPNDNALKSALATLSAHAVFQGPERQSAVRLAKHDGAVYIDLCDDEWRAVKVTADGWQVIDGRDAPIAFVRAPGMKALPVPERGGSIGALRPLMNISDDDQWILLVGWIVGAVQPEGPYPVLCVSGEQGSSKSTLCKIVRCLLDPNAANTRRLPKDERDLFIAARNGRVLSFNNISDLRPQLSDALCAIAADGGFATRTLYTDHEETIFEGRRPVVLNGIEAPATRPDLIDRGVHLRLPEIPPERRREEAHILAELDEKLPGILGALLDALSASLANRATVVLERKPRLADFAVAVTAAAPALGWGSHDFVDAYEANRREADWFVIEGSPVGLSLIDLVRNSPWRGTATELLVAIKGLLPKEVHSDLPNSRGLRSAFERLKPCLRAAGVEVVLPSRPTGREKRRVIMIKPIEPADGAARAAGRIGFGDSGGGTAA